MNMSLVLDKEKEKYFEKFKPNLLRFLKATVDINSVPYGDFKGKSHKDFNLPEYVYGVDINHLQGEIDFKKVHERNCCVIIKATEGSNWAQPKLKEYALNADKENFPLSYYHFATIGYGNSNDSTEEALNFLESIAKLPTPKLPLALDLEKIYDTNPLSKNQRADWVINFLNIVSAASKTGVMLYTSERKLEEIVGDVPELYKYALWLPRYGNNDSIPERWELPKLPKGWKEWVIWQFTSNYGKDDGVLIDGIERRADRNIIKTDWLLSLGTINPNQIKQEHSAMIK